MDWEYFENGLGVIPHGWCGVYGAKDFYSTYIDEILTFHAALIISNNFDDPLFRTPPF